MLKCRELRKERAISQRQLADRLGISRSTVAMWETGASRPDSQSLKTLSDLFGVSIDYLLDNNPSPSRGIKIPVLGRVQAGIPVEAVEDILDYEEITCETAAQGEFFALQIKGASMEPKFSEGDVVIVRRQSDVDSGDIAIALVNGNDATVKKIVKHPDGIYLMPLNAAFPPQFFSTADIAALPISILGKVVELRAKF